MTEKPEQSVEQQVPEITQLYFDEMNYLSSNEDKQGGFLNIKNNTILGNQIVTAYNNTYGKGINPEAVSDIKKALEIYLNAGGKDARREASVIAKEALKKSELK